jgi:hypothetical protein
VTTPTKGYIIHPSQIILRAGFFCQMANDPIFHEDNFVA